MVISYVHRFLFVHVYKAAGMSIEKALWPYDVRASLTGKLPAEQHAQLQEIGVSPAILGLQRHTVAKDVKGVLGDDLFRTLFKFAIVRNPWDLQLSLYHFNLKHPEFPAHKEAMSFPTFEAYILARDPTPHARGQQRQFVVDDDGRFLTDFIGRFETLTEDFAAVCKRLGIPSTLGHINSSEHPPWQKSYTPRMFEIVRDIHRIDLETFGYSDDPAAYGLA